MGKYARYDYRQVRERPWKIHPIWRGIGFFLIILIPVMSFAGAVLLVRQNFEQQWVKLPPDLLRSISTPGLTGIYPGLSRIYTADLAVMAALMVLGFGLLAIIYSLLYGTLGPSRYGPVDSPPIRRSPKRRPR